MVHYKFPASQILVFAKAPVKNQVKTRLAREVGAEKALALYCAMLEQTIETTTKSQCCPVSLYCAPDSSHPTFEALSRKYPLILKNQTGNDLGARMLHAASKSLNAHSSVVIVGTDCLQLTESLLGQVLAGLTSNSCDAIITPAEDGGYVLLGLNRTVPALFEGIDWGSGEVMEQTRRALERLGWRWQETQTLRDIDTFEDIKYLYENEHQYPLNTGVRESLYTIFKKQTAGYE